LLDRILDKGLVVVGDIRISLVSVELLTLRIRLVLCSIDKAEQVGLDWWRHEPSLAGHGDGESGKLPANGTAAQQNEHSQESMEQQTAAAPGGTPAGNDSSGVDPTARGVSEPGAKRKDRARS